MLPPLLLSVQTDAPGSDGAAIVTGRDEDDVEPDPKVRRGGRAPEARAEAALGELIARARAAVARSREGRATLEELREIERGISRLPLIDRLFDYDLDIVENDIKTEIDRIEALLNAETQIEKEPLPEGDTLIEEPLPEGGTQIEVDTDEEMAETQPSETRDQEAKSQAEPGEFDKDLAEADAVLNAGQTQGDLPPGRDRGGAARVAEREERLRQVLQQAYELLLIPSRSGGAPLRRGLEEMIKQLQSWAKQYERAGRMIQVLSARLARVGDEPAQEAALPPQNLADQPKLC